MAWTVAVEKETKQEGEKHPKEAQHTGVTKRAQNPAQEHNTKDTKTHYRKGREKPLNCTKITTESAMGVRQETYKGKTQNQNSKGWRRWAEQHTQTHQTEWERERVSLLGLPTTCNNNSFFQKSPKIRTGRKNHQIAATWRSGSQEEEKNYWQAFGHNRVANVHQGM
jgi:hypothetical protein